MGLVVGVHPLKVSVNALEFTMVTAIQYTILYSLVGAVP